MTIDYGDKDSILQEPEWHARDEEGGATFAGYQGRGWRGSTSSCRH